MRSWGCEVQTADSEASHAGERHGARRRKTRRAEVAQPLHAQPLRAAFAPATVPRSFISRPHLARRLQEEREASTFLLAAPAGYGKTTLLSEWAARDGRSFAWLELGAADDDAPHLLARICAALRSLAATGAPPRRGSRAVPGPEGEVISPAEVIALAEQLVRDRGEVVLVLDDAHHVRSRAAREQLAALAHGLPAAVKLALASRGEPRLRLGRLRAAHRLLALGPGELAMSAVEAQLVLEAAEIELDEESIEQLVERTEGWPAAVYLAALSQSERSGTGEPAQPQSQPVDHLSAEYIREEVLGQLGDDARDLLTRGAALDELCGELCDAMLERGETGPLLRQLASETLLLIPLDPGHTWYRMHTLLREVLRAELEICEPESLPGLHRRASVWFAANGQIDRAIEQSVAARDARRAGALLWQEGGRFLFSGDPRVHRWVESFTAEEAAASAELSLAAAHIRLAGGDLPAARHLSRLAGEAIERDEPATASSLRAGAMLIDAAAGAGGIEQVVDSSEQAIELLGEASFLRPLACVLDGVGRHLLGEREAARDLLGEGIGACTRTMPSLLALGLAQLALLDVDERDWEQAEDRAARAIACLEEHGLEGHAVAALPLAVSALTLSHRGLADEAKRALTTGGRLLEGLGEHTPWYEVETRIAMARASTRLADVARARTLLSQASRWARRPRAVPCFVAWLDEAWGEIDDVSAAALHGTGSLTMAELRVLRFLPTHLSFREIGERLHVSGNTVKSQAHAVYAKLAAGSRTEAVAHAAALGLIDPPVV